MSDYKQVVPQAGVVFLARAQNLVSCVYLEMKTIVGLLQYTSAGCQQKRLAA